MTIYRDINVFLPITGDEGTLHFDDSVATISSPSNQFPVLTGVHGREHQLSGIAILQVGYSNNHHGCP